ncbi:hypothetical protein [Gemmata sp.]|uniref:hypothetical protein n=1 Tax=Gemmata sp. TaxID=1914242 RepID=UPI003F6E6DC2
MRYLLTLAAAGVCVGAASAQFPAQPSPGTQPQGPQYPAFGGTPLNPNTVMPNVYNPATQPLSPYLNLLRGGNAGVNYFYGVRPGTVGGWGGGGGGAPFMAGGGARTSFFPQLAAAPDPLETVGLDGAVLPPAGHPVVFSNTMGYFPSPAGQAGGARSGLAGLGARRPGGR